jgi:hypothetical protein
LEAGFLSDLLAYCLLPLHIDRASHCEVF